MAYAVGERAKIAVWYEWTKSVVMVQRKFRTEMRRDPPSKDSIKKWHKALMETGSVQNVKRKRSRSAHSAENSDRVEEHFSENPNSSTRRAVNALGISRRTIQRILKDLKWHPYKIQIVQKITDEDKENRLEFAQDEIERISINPNHLPNLLFSDEAHFHLDGGVNRHNHRYWAAENPHWFVEESLHSPRTTVWAAIGERGVIGPFFFDETINSERYLAMLQTHFHPELELRQIQNDIIFMQDGAPPHWGRMVRNWLNENFPNRWMGRGSVMMPWPPRSPDLTPCDFFLWGFIKSKVYTTRPENIEELKNRIITAFDEITVEMRMKILLEYRERLYKIVENDGSHVEV